MVRPRAGRLHLGFLPVPVPLPLIVRELGGAGTPLVVLHGLLGSSRNWQSAGVALAERGHRVLAPDLRNHGSSPWGDDCSYAALSADVIALLDRLALGPVHLVGHSMGGKVAMRLVMNRPDLVARLTIVDIAPRAYSDRVRVEFAAMNSLDLVSVGWTVNREALTNSLPEILGNPLSAGEVWNGPTRFLRGGKSNYIRDEDAATIRAHFPQADVVTLPDSGHNPHFEARAGFVEATLA